MTKDRNAKTYANGKIYIIRNTVNESTYIGSTTQLLSLRMALHRKATRNPRANKYQIYRTMNELGIDNFFIELIEYFSCNTQEELRRREGELIKQHKSDLNKYIAGRTWEQYCEDNKEVRRENDRIRGKSEAVLQKRRERKYECRCCGSVVRTDGKAEHERTKKHQENMLNIISK